MAAAPLRPRFAKKVVLLAALGTLGLVLLLSAVHRGVFLVDENNYLVSVIALRQGKLTAPYTEGLPASAALEYFDPGSGTRGGHRSPVPLSTPPLYAPIAAPFSLLGWPGLVLLNVLSLLGALWALFGYAARHARLAQTPWIAAGLLGIGSYCIEYAQGVWPQMLAMALCLGGLVLASRTADEERGARWWLAPLLGGLLAGWAIGVRYQNILFAGCVGLGVLIWGRRRIADSALYGAGVALPLGACSALNYVRLGWLNPIKKQPGYLKLDGRAAARWRGATLAAAGPGGVLEPLWTFWAKVVDFSTHPVHLGGEERTWMPKDPRTGAFIYLGALKKAWLQSAPWLLLGLVGLIAAWAHRPRPAGDRGEGQAADAAPSVGVTASRELRRLSLVVGPVLGVFSLAGFSRDDGMCFNQRYFIELLPLLAVATAWLLERFEPVRWRLALIGGLVGALVIAALLRLPVEDALRQLTLLKLPLALAALLGLCWLVAGRAARLVGAALPLLLGASVAWAAGVHLGDDLVVSREVRQLNRGRLAAVEAVLPPHGKAAVFAHFTSKDALGPLQLAGDVVIADTHLDGGASAPALVKALFGQGRRVFVLAPGMPRAIFERIAQGRRVRAVARKPVLVLELSRGSSPPL